MRDRSLWLAVVLSSVLFLPLSAAAAEDIGNMNWKSGDISALGVGVPSDRYKSPARRRVMACAAAKVVAQANLLEVTKGVRVDSVSLVRDAMLESQMIRTAVKGTLVGARMTERRMMDDGSCEVTMTIPMAGKLFSALISEQEYYKRVGGGYSQIDFSERMQQLSRYLSDYGFVREAHASMIPVIRIEDESQLLLAKRLVDVFTARRDLVAASLMQNAIKDYENISDFTGIVIDASHLPEFQAAMLPQIRDHEGVSLYPNKDTPYEVVRRRMPFSYEMDVSDAMSSDRVANKPLIIKAVSTYESRQSDLMLDKAGEQRFIEVVQKGELNDKAKIMIVLFDQ